jgi:hypothetical protein
MPDTSQIEDWRLDEWERFERDYPYFASECLVIRPKDPTKGLTPFVLNTAQTYLHKVAERQRAKTGKVRIIVLKGRQEGISTYVCGRLYWRASFSRGIRAFILTHLATATDNLFGMTQRFHQNSPLAPATGKASANELSFAKLDSSYKVGTARTEGVGRSDTIQFFHGSEVPLWDNAKEHVAGIMEAVPDMPGTEVWLEGTSQGMGNVFYEYWVKAVKGQSSFEAVFIPWFWQAEYRAAVPEGFHPTTDEQEIIDLYGLDDEQVLWRRSKIAEMGIEKFKREYPCTPEEAFQETGADVLIGSKLVRAAIGRDVRQVEAPIIWGIDCARFGDDDNTIAKRRGNKLLEPVRVILPGVANTDTMAVARAIKREFQTTPPSKRPAWICIDAIGIGAGVADRCREDGLPAMDVNVAEKPSSREKFNRLRDELWWDMREWFEDMRTSMPEDEALLLEISAVTYDETSAGRIKIEAKKDMKKRLGFSPDRAEAFLMTFAASDQSESKRSYEPGSVEADVG